MSESRELSQRDLAATLGLSTQQIRNLEDRGLPHRAEGRRKFYPVPEAVQWYVAFKRDEAVDRSGGQSFEKARARREEARARLAEIEVAKAEREVFPIEVVEEVYGQRLLSVLRSGILNMPGRYGAQVTGLESPREGEAALTEIAHDLLEEFSGPAADVLEVGEEPLPEDVPDRAVLVAAGIETMAQLLGVADLQSLPGIGPVREERIVDWIEGGRSAA